MDVVLFGPSNGSKSQWIKDLIAVFSVIVGITLSIYSYYVLKGSKVHVSKMMKDMESLQKSEAQLSMLQEELDRAMDERKNIFNEKSKLEERLMKEIEKLESNSMMSKSMSDNDLSSSCPNIYEKDVDSRVAALERELKETREQLEQANKSWTPPHQLQLWLQLTHELEVKAYNIKKAAAEHALLAAKDGVSINVVSKYQIKFIICDFHLLQCEKLRRKRQAFMGSFRVAHGSSLDEVDNRIVAAKGALSEVTKDLHERLTRWRQIEKLTGLDIVNNPGLESLQSSLVISSLPGFAGHVQTPSSDGTSSITRTNSDGTIHSNEDTFM